MTKHEELHNLLLTHYYFGGPIEKTSTEEGPDYCYYKDIADPEFGLQRYRIKVEIVDLSFVTAEGELSIRVSTHLILQDNSHLQLVKTPYFLYESAHIKAFEGVFATIYTTLDCKAEERNK